MLKEGEGKGRKDYKGDRVGKGRKGIEKERKGTD